MIIREERIGNQRLILGDCLAVMPTLGRFDAVVTDPPYGLGKKLAHGEHFKKHHDKIMEWDAKADQRWIDAIVLASKDAMIWGGELLHSSTFARVVGLE